jgi:hypothetical protein
MDTNLVLWAIGFPLLLFFVALGFGSVFAVTSSDSVGFWVAKACFAAASFVLIAMAVYCVLATRQRMPWNIIVPLIAAIFAAPGLVVLWQWVEQREMLLSTWLFPRDDYSRPLPPLAAGLPKTALKLIMGTNVATAKKFPHTVVRVFGEDLIQIDKDASRDQVVISTLKIFDDRNNVIARLDAEDGFWVENSTRRKRPDSSTLVVFDHLDREVLRIDFANPTTVYVTGVFRHPQLRQPIVITPENAQISGNTFSNTFFSDNAADIVIGR